MKGAPGFTAWPDSVDGMWKIELLRWLGKAFGIKTLVETGTCEGITPFNLHNDFEQIFTIELHDGLFENARQRLAPFSNVKLYHGSSRTELDKVLNDVPEGPTLFWLDAHSSGPHTANDGDPLPDELLVIARRCPKALIVIDDMRGLGEFWGQVWSVSTKLEGWTAEYRTGEIILYQDKYYSIPPFES
jgi:hypothetical protein